MGLVAEPLIVLVRAESRIHAIVVRRGVAVIGREAVLRVGRVILQHGGKPEGRHPQLLEVVEVLTDTVQVAAVSEAWLRAVLHVVAHALDLGVVVCALRKTVGHQHVEHVGIGESQALLTFLLARLQLVWYFRLAKIQNHRTWLGVAEIQVDEQVVGRVEAHQTVDGYTRIVRRHVLHVADALSVDHQLYGGVLHPYIPVGGLNSVNHTFLRCTHCHDVCHQDGGYN